MSKYPILEEQIDYNEDDLATIQLSMGAVLWNKEKDKILIQKHRKFGFYTIPIGKVNKGETVENCVIRELFEECGITVLDSRLIKNRWLVYKRRGIDVTVLGHLYEIIDYAGKPYNKEPHKHDFQQFMFLEDLHKIIYISDMTRIFLEEYNEFAKLSLP